METAALAKELNELLAMETHSLLRHVHSSTPHVDARTYRVWRTLRSIARHDDEHARRLSALMERHDIPEQPASFSPAVGNFHYMTIDRMLPLLLEEKRAQVATYHRAIRYAARDEDTVNELEALWADNNAELEQLEALAAELAKSGDRHVPVERTADPQNVANVLAAREKLAIAKGEKPAEAPKPAKPAKAEKAEKGEKAAAGKGEKKEA